MFVKQFTKKNKLLKTNLLKTKHNLEEINEIVSLQQQIMMPSNKLMQNKTNCC